MIGIEAMAFHNPNLDKVQGIFSEVSHTIERPLDDFDRSHSRSVAKKQVFLAIKKADSLVDQVNQMIAAGYKMIAVLRKGDLREIEELELKEDSALVLGKLASELKNGNNRLAYTFFKAESDGSWSPHMSQLRYIKTKSMQAFEEYKNVTEELYRLVDLYLVKQDDEFNFDISVLNESIESDTIRHPEWVKNGDDFVGWIQSMKKEA
ncbi:hypothetical protein J3D56_004237 [Erwinia persicina]|uniref:hypothetical protein n=1 Tax=Erwinia persicina TaxID=55211 RepID=UPI0020A15D86|nr:hypothetical protein [Erwinia persicina]MCP1440801.1 hypothetical protein [Erwinia persicina]